MVASPKLSSRKVPTKSGVKTRANAASKKQDAVIAFHRLPHDFSEKEVRAFFGQFGRIFKLRLSRSNKTGNSRGYGFIQYELPDVAKIAVDATNNYFIGGKPIRTEILNPEAVHKGLFIGAPAGNHALHRSAKVRKAHNKTIHGLVEAEKLDKDVTRSAKLAALGIEYDFTRRVVEKKPRA